MSKEEGDPLQPKDTLSRREFFRTGGGLLWGAISFYGLETGPQELIPGGEESLEQQGKGLEAPFAGLASGPTLSSEYVLQPEGKALPPGELYLMKKDELQQRGELANILLPEGGSYPRITAMMESLGMSSEEIAAQMGGDRLVIAHGAWVDSFLDFSRGGSEGTTLFIQGEQGTIVGLMIAVHSKLLFGERPQILNDTVIEETIQAVVYQKFLEARSAFPEEFMEMGVASNQDIVNKTTNGNLRAFLEFVQHVAIRAVNQSWLFFPYELEIAPHPRSRNIAEVEADFFELLHRIQPNGTDEMADFLRLFGDPQQLTQFLQEYADDKRSLWSHFGMMRDGMRVFPYQEYRTPMQMSVVECDPSVAAAAREKGTTFPDKPLSEYATGDIVYVVSNTLVPVFSLITDREGKTQRVTPNQNAIVPQDRVLRVKITEPGIGQVQPDNGMYNPFGNGFQDIYVNLSDFRLIPDLEPVNLFEGTRHEEKEIVVVKGDHPEILLVEKGKIILRTPAVLGASQPTPIGDHRISQTRVSRHMPGQIGVGFPNYFGGGRALHASPWWNWQDIRTGFYGSHGCINLPEEAWGSVETWNGNISIAQFVYKWIRTNIFNDVVENDQAQVRWDDAGYSEGISSVRLLIVSEPADLLSYSHLADGSSFEDVYRALAQMEDEAWVLPSIV